MPTDSEIIVQGIIMDIIHRSVKEANPIYEDIPVASGLENQDKLAYLVENCVLDNCFVVEDEKEMVETDLSLNGAITSELEGNFVPIMELARYPPSPERSPPRQLDMVPPSPASCSYTSDTEYQPDEQNDEDSDEFLPGNFFLLFHFI